MADLRSTAVSRRVLVRGGLSLAGSLAAAGFIACGSSKSKAPSSAATSTGAQAGPSQGTPAGGAKPGASSGESNRRYARLIPPTDKPPKTGGTLAMSIGQDVGSFDTTKSGAIGNLAHTGTVYEALLRRKTTTKEAELPGTGSPQTDIEGALAQSWEISPDGLTYTFKIRPNVKWQNVAPLNGRAFAAEDVRKAYQRYATTGVWQSNFLNVAKMDVPDAQTLTITLKQPSADFIVPLAEQNNAIFPMELVDNGSIDKVAIGTGPMIMKEVQPGQVVRYVRNPDYWGQKTYLDGFEFRIIQDSSAALAAFRAGQIGSASATTPRDVEAVRPSVQGMQVAQPVYRKSIFFSAFNMKNPKWQDERVRQAFSLSLDRDTINATLYENLSNVLPVMPWIHVFDHEPTAKSGELGKWWHYDPAEAKKLLQAAGVDSLKFDYPYYNGYLTNQNDVLFDQWKRAGFQVNPQQLDYVAFNAQLAGVKYPDAIQAWDPHGTQADNYFKNQIKSDSAGNWFTINDPQLDSLADAQSIELDPNKRKTILRQMWDRILDKCYRVELMNSTAFSMVQPWLHGFTYIVGNDGLGPGPFGYYNSQFVSAIWMDK